MIRVIALTQFAFTTIGSVAVIVLTRSQSIPSSGPGGVRGFLAANALWMLLLPLVWLAFVATVVRFSDSPRVEGFARATGIVFATLIAALYVWVIFTF